jgi:hypothetical protein
MRIRLNEKWKSKSSKSKSKPMRVASTWWRGFGEPLLLAGEDAALYRELHAHVHAAVQPADMIEEMLVDDVVSLEWEVLRWRKLKSALMRARGLKALESFLRVHLDYSAYRDKYEDFLTDILQEHLPEDQAKTLAHKSALSEPEADEEVEEILLSTDRRMDVLLDDAKNDKAQELAQEYAQHDRNAVALVDELLERRGTNMNTLVADALAENFEDIERIDRLTTLAEGRRNASLREIDRHRLVLGESLRRTVQQIEESGSALIELAPSKGQEAA